MKKIEFDGYLLVYQADDSEGRWKGSYAILKDRAEITRGSLPLAAHSEDDAVGEILAAARRQTRSAMAA
ncbi:MULTISPECIES: hypothetical protein [Herbaspirillum]|jgi:hypothetical protein|uniref:Uncharacterized protein n=1 Tax=Herbaspirillum aquaticum TaxID=568783 RepID=A0A225SXL4_9BURK|nr:MULTISPECIES: hypothetical protein [Herbaspirillum]MBW9331978.1 hypothetical protein [Herbaspirillum sp. RU 5E]MRT28745.1 hypothetical protein [Herbaspirillum sp. CAH-3]OWY35566.1 hypothetical protein CEJ45_07055 [Herbaspirillum aquaticum]